MVPFTYNLPGFRGVSAIENRDPSQGEIVSNFWVRESSLQVRDGCTEQIGTATITASLESLSMLQTKAGDKYYLGAASNSLYMATASFTAWGSALKSDCDNAYFDAVNFRDSLYLTNGVDRLVYDGSTLSSITSSSPACTFIDTWKERLFGNRTASPTYIYYSDAGTASNFAINYQGVSGSDADKLIGTVPVLNFLLTLNRYSGYAAYGTGTPYTIPKVSSVGAVSRRSMVNINEVAYWLSDNGVYAYGGGSVNPVTFDLGDITEIINMNYADKSCAVAWRDYYLLACPEAEETTNTQVLAFDTLRKTWAQVKFPFSINDFQTDGNDLYAPATNGKVYKLFGGAANDAGTAITATWVSDNLDLGRPGKLKKVKKIAIEVAEISTGGTFSVYLKTDGGSWSDPVSVSIPTGEPGKTVIVPVQTVKFYNLQVKIVTTAKVTINKMSFGGKVNRAVK